MTRPGFEDAVGLRHPTEDDQPRVVSVADHWFAGRRVWPLLVRAWFRDFGGTSLIADAPDGSPRAFLLGYRSPERPDEAVLHLLGVDPNHRRRGLGRLLVERFAADAAANAAAAIRAVAWPDDPIAVAFFRGVGFEAEAGPGSQRLYGVPAYADFEAAGEDRVVWVRRLGGPG
jgi:ribosomal protein S18 acetylase RimI-like enzyme